MINIAKSLAVGACIVAGSMGPASAATNQAVLNVNATVTNNCDVLTQPATVSTTFNTIQSTSTKGTSSFTYACTNGASVSVNPTSPNVAQPGVWRALNGSNGLGYYLFNDLACTTNQLTNGTSEGLGSGTGSSQTYNICAIVAEVPQNVPAGVYTDTVTFTFNFGP